MEKTRAWNPRVEGCGHKEGQQPPEERQVIVPSLVNILTLAQ